jgi:hypothetical protein
MSRSNGRMKQKPPPAPAPPPPPKPKLTPRQYKDGSGWYIEAVGEDGIPEHIGGFISDSDAHDWISLKSTACFKAREQ